MADNRLNKTGLAYFWNRIKGIFATKDEMGILADKVDLIISEGGEPNAIDSITINGSVVTPDANKNVAFNVPTAMSQLTNDGDGTLGSHFATESYVDQNGGKIDAIKVNGQLIAISNKEVDIPVPTKVSGLTNDMGFQTEAQVQTAINTAVSSIYRYKGSVESYNNLPAIANVGDVYDVQDTGMNYAWSGTSWDALGQLIDVSMLWAKNELVAIPTAEIDEIIDA